jgi:hypothetical protein
MWDLFSCKVTTGRMGTTVGDICGAFGPGVWLCLSLVMPLQVAGVQLTAYCWQSSRPNYQSKRQRFCTSRQTSERAYPMHHSEDASIQSVCSKTDTLCRSGAPPQPMSCKLGKCRIRLPSINKDYHLNLIVFSIEKRCTLNIQHHSLRQQIIMAPLVST